MQRVKYGLCRKYCKNKKAIFTVKFHCRKSEASDSDFPVNWGMQIGFEDSGVRKKVEKWQVSGIFGLVYDHPLHLDLTHVQPLTLISALATQKRKKTFPMP